MKILEARLPECSTVKSDRFYKVAHINYETRRIKIIIDEQKGVMFETGYRDFDTAELRIVNDSLFDE